MSILLVRAITAAVVAAEVIRRTPSLQAAPPGSAQALGGSGTESKPAGAGIVEVDPELAVHAFYYLWYAAPPRSDRSMS